MGSDDQQNTWAQPGITPSQPSPFDAQAGTQRGSDTVIPSDSGNASADHQQADTTWQQPGWTQPGGAQTGTAQSESPQPGSQQDFQQPGGANPQFGAQTPPPSWGMPGMSWAPAPQPGIIPLQPLRFTELFEGSFKAVQANPPVMFGFSLVVMAFVSVLAAVLQALLTPSIMSELNDPQAALAQADEATWIASEIVSSLTSTILPTIATAVGTVFVIGILALSVSDAVLGKVTPLKGAWQRFKPRFWALLGLTIVENIMLIFALFGVAFLLALPLIVQTVGGSEPSVAFILLLIFGLFAGFVTYFALSVKLLFASNAVVLEGASPFKAIARSWRLTRGAFWQTVGRYLTITLVTSAAAAAIGGIAGVFTALGTVLISESVAIPLSTVLTGVASALILPITSAWVTLMYIDRRMKTENLGPVLQAAAVQ